MGLLFIITKSTIRPDQTQTFRIMLVTGFAKLINITFWFFTKVINFFITSAVDDIVESEHRTF